MSRRILVFLLAAATAGAAEDAWAKVRELKSGAEVRIYKRAANQALLGTFDEVTEENLIVVIKNEQLAIPKEQIDRLDARPMQRGSRVNKQTKVTSGERLGGRVAPQGPSAGARGNPAAPSSSASTSVGIGSKPDFETVYRRPVAALAK